VDHAQAAGRRYLGTASSLSAAAAAPERGNGHG
jgi:hypothetical protein